MRIMLDGCDGSGKSTLSNLLAEKHNCDIVHMTLWSSKTFGSYINRMTSFDNIIFDRCFISEYIYSKVFNRTTDIDDKKVKMLIDIAKSLGYNIYIMTTTNENIKNRLNKRNDENDEILNNIDKINNEYIDFAKKFNIKLIREEDINNEII